MAFRRGVCHFTHTRKQATEVLNIQTSKEEEPWMELTTKPLFPEALARQ